MIEVKDVSFSYVKNKNVLSNVSLSIDRSERVGLVAPSGYGKTTLANILVRKLIPDSGTVELNDIDINKKMPYPVQIIPQHPEKAFNPRWKLNIVEKEIGKRIPDFVKEGLDLKEEWMSRYPNELSGGELQRISIARIVSVDPKYIIADEISTMLDAVTQAKIWKFILKYVESRKVGLLVMSHNPELLRVTCTKKIYLTNL